jgi:hypothetical protein
MRLYSNTLKFSFILIFINSFSYLEAKNYLPSFDTTRLKSTGGAGIASPLLDEVNYLNPASSAFFNIGSVYLQKNSLTGESTSSAGSPVISEFDQIGVIASDAKGSRGGSASYNKMTIGEENIKQISASVSSPIGKKSALGIAFNYIDENIFNQNDQLTQQKYKVTTFGVTHALNESLFLGLVLKDAFRSKENNTRATVGLHYLYRNYINVMLDVGTDYKDELSERAKWNAAAEIKIMSDFMLRFGFFDDKGLAIKGSGIGVGWIQPRLTLEIALKNTDVLASEVLFQEESQLKETTLSMSYRF